ncbi:DUF4865 family protein [Serratia aquatilis]|uniref:DUF4865 family protein n=1 Tax=Serratia aquatilis TaxID=1737515 RepID=A0ABV6EK82_9GAMM
MIAMQYRFTLPADYYMNIIRHRIADFGHLMDAHRQLIFKAYLYALKGEQSMENTYAPFYLWNSNQGMSDFVCGSGFRGVSQAFGWPRVDCWLPWLVQIDRQGLTDAHFATSEYQPILPHCDLSLLRSQQQANPLALASIVAFNPTSWHLMHFHLWREKPELTNNRTQCYQVGHISAPLDNSLLPQTGERL